MLVVINYEDLEGSHNETDIKEVALIADGVIRTRHFQAPYDMRPHGSAENVLNWDGGNIPIISYKCPLPTLWRYTHICIHTALRTVEIFPTW
jgi:hypothetical protein